MKQVNFDFGKTIGQFKPMNAVNNGPVKKQEGRKVRIIFTHIKMRVFLTPERMTPRTIQNLVDRILLTLARFSPILMPILMTLRLMILN